MDDLFAQAEEIREERAAIREFDGGLTREEAEKAGLLDSREWLTACLVRHVASMESFEDRKDFVEDYRKKHGDAAADLLRDGLVAERARRLGK